MRTNGNAALPLSTCRRPLIIAPLEIKSVPSIDVTVARGSISVSPCNAWAIHSHPARVERAY